MSLKAFHVVVITAASAMSFGSAVWMWREYRAPEGTSGDLIWAIGWVLVGLSLLVYERRFLKKLKNVSYL